MKLKNAIFTGALAVSALGSMSAYAVPVFGTAPGGSADNAFINTVFGAGAEIEGWYNADLWASGAGTMTITADYFGAEASEHNQFLAGAGSFTHNGLSDPSHTITGSVLASFNFTTTTGYVPFRFLAQPSVGGGIILDNAVGGNQSNTIAFVPNFFVTLASAPGTASIDRNGSGTTNWGGTTAWLFLDDGRGGPDDNHDDLVVRLTITGGTFNVPEPATLGLLGLGLVGMGALRRKRKA